MATVMRGDETAGDRAAVVDLVDDGRKSDAATVLMLDLLWRANGYQGAPARRNQHEAVAGAIRDWHSIACLSRGFLCALPPRQAICASSARNVKRHGPQTKASEALDHSLSGRDAGISY